MNGSGASVIRKVLFAAAALAITAAMSGCQGGGLTLGSRDLLDTAGAQPGLATFTKAVRAAGLEQEMRGSQFLTVLAPSDEAFAKMSPGTLDDLLKPRNVGKLRDVLKYHMVPGRLNVRQLADAGATSTLQGQRVFVIDYRNMVMVNDARLTGAEIPCSNGAIYIIDRVLMP